MEPTARSTSHEANHPGGKLQAMLHICQKMNAERDLATLLELIAREAARLMEADRATIFLLDREKHELWSQVALDSAPIRFAAHLGVAGATALTGQTNNVTDVQQDPRFYAAIDTRKGYHTRNLLAVPLRNYTAEVIGTFEMLNKQGGAFTTDDEELLKALAAQAAIAIETAQFVQELQQHRDRLIEENGQLRQEVEGRFSTAQFIGTHVKVQRIVRLIEQIRHSSVSVLITGESGTGKELLAKAIHYNSPRARRALVALNCAGLPESLAESELFGIERGVATGVEQRIGKFEEANGGTLFLDEVGDLSLTAQAKILRALQERVIERVGGRKALPIDVRILAATNKELEQEIEKGTFREDLYYRLKVIHIHTPPLREISEDIPLLANFFLANYCREMQKNPKQLTPGALKHLQHYAWPGNVRELENEMKRLVVLTQRTAITEEDLSDTIRHGGDEGWPAGITAQQSLKQTVEDMEKRLIREALEIYRNNQQQTARSLGLSRQGLIKKMKRYGIRAARALDLRTPAARPPL